MSTSSSSSSSSSSRAPPAKKASAVRKTHPAFQPPLENALEVIKTKRRHAPVAMRSISRRLGLHEITTTAPTAAELMRVAMSAFAGHVIRGALLSVANSPANHSTIDAASIDTGLRLCTDRAVTFANVRRRARRLRSLQPLLLNARERRATRRQKYHDKLVASKSENDSDGESVEQDDASDAVDA